MKKRKELSIEQLKKAAHVSALLGIAVKSLRDLGIPYETIGVGIVVFVREECAPNIENFIDMLRDCDDAVRLSEVKK